MSETPSNCSCGEDGTGSHPSLPDLWANESEDQPQRANVAPVSPDPLPHDERLAWTFALLRYPQGTSWSNMSSVVFSFVNESANQGRLPQLAGWRESGDAWREAGFTPATYELLNATVNAVAPALLESGRVSDRDLASFGIGSGTVGFRRGCLDVAQWRDFPNLLGTAMTTRLVEATLLREPARRD